MPAFCRVAADALPGLLTEPECEAGLSVMPNLHEILRPHFAGWRLMPYPTYYTL
ncbi:hypothetical protein [uncultured Klebsiella sp.]|uniref:hypothetical protein n=1 Tax=uncultured Klebsiella sp. TaxID=284011 RepID=UPI002804C199|nr:hypothetical protein [uncultured Klebsiella sp.]